MYSMNLPKPFVMLDIAKLLLDKHGIRSLKMNLQPYVFDLPALAGVWPVYEEIGERLGVPGHYAFKLGSDMQADQPLRVASLKEYVDASFAAFSKYSRDNLECDRLHREPYQQLLRELLFNRPDAAHPHAAETGKAATRWVRPNGEAMTVAVLGNAQAGGMARCLQALLGGPTPSAECVTAEQLSSWENGHSSLASLFESHDKVFIQPWIWNAVASRHAAYQDQVVLYPSVAFMAYHPDFVEIRRGTDGDVLSEGPTGRCHSSLAFLAWKSGLDVAQTVALFQSETFEQLGYFEFWRSSEQALLEEGQAAGLPLDDLLSRWKARGCFMHMPAHPKLFVIADIARALIDRLGIPALPQVFAEYVHDHLANDLAWPVYPPIAQVLGCRGSFEFKLRQSGAIDQSLIPAIGLQPFVEQSFAAFSKHQADELTCARLDWPEYRQLAGHLQSAGATNAPDPATACAEAPRDNVEAKEERAKHPYAGLPNHKFWRKAIETVPYEIVDPVIRTKFKIQSDTKVATAGSCFALNISKRLVQRGYNFLLAEAAPDESEDSIKAVGGNGLFSARFGYVYTARQLRQLMERAYGRFVPDDRAWTNKNGRLVDPFRPRIEPEGFRSIEALEEARDAHFAAVREMFESLDVLVFTLGLTEAWRARSDGAVFSVAPGVAGGEMDFDKYEFVNFSVAEVDADLQAFIDELKRVNPGAKVILTVSPVPMVATYADKHVLVSTTYTKSVLRVAAEQVTQRNDFCDYFPGYELVNGNYHRGRYFSDDLRSVTPEGVDHVMRLFFAHYAGDGAIIEPDAKILAQAPETATDVCDEELLQAAIR